MPLTVDRLRPLPRLPALVADVPQNDVASEGDGSKSSKSDQSMRKRVFSKVRDGVLRRSLSHGKQIDSNASEKDANLSTTSTISSDSCSMASARGGTKKPPRPRRNRSDKGLRLRAARDAVHHQAGRGAQLAADLSVDDGLEEGCDTVRATVKVHAIDDWSAVHDSSGIEDVRLYFRRIVLKVKPADAYTAAITSGPLYVDSLAIGEEFVVNVELRKIPGDRSVFGPHEDLYDEIQSLLGENTIGLFSVKLTYLHPNFAFDTSLVLRKICMVKLQQGQSCIEPPVTAAEDEVPVGQTQAMIRLPDAEMIPHMIPPTSKGSQQTKPAFSGPSDAEKVPHDTPLTYKGSQRMGTSVGSPADEERIPHDTPPTYKGSHQTDPTMSSPSDAEIIPRGTRPANKDGQRTHEDPHYPDHGTDPPAAVLGQMTCSRPSQECVSDAAREVWRHIRRDSSRNTSGLGPARDGKVQLTRHEAGLVVSAMKKVALSNKRSVDEETLREWEEGFYLASRLKEGPPEFDVPCGIASVPWL
ncbi:hypothetical protein CAC42_2137 [Sphaceloma murrayae]|uniref:Uncharacterized protein n=1 Tax=Sphaceloma murrayae TaxID=2082308 RepID=A0A2K1QIB8_9PEZI|nr:hypothetical protein CAC42_2137 [Sphaceloma murrayae]